jgi:2-phospho-L-lactate/phosphoenolpyruvate guanylyltransferase
LQVQRSWSVVVPAKRLSVAKTRLRPLTEGQGVAPAGHAELVLALLADTVAAITGCPAVRSVVVVTDEPDAAEVAHRLGARTVADAPGRGLNAALLHGASAAGGGPVATVSSDLPALRPEELAGALAEAARLAAAGVPRSFTADAAGTGTTLLAAVSGGLDPHFGAGSAAAHERSGAARLPARWPGLSRDVDTPADLRAAALLGLGPATSALTRRLAGGPAAG